MGTGGRRGARASLQAVSTASCRPPRTVESETYLVMVFSAPQLLRRHRQRARLPYGAADGFVEVGVPRTAFDARIRYAPVPLDDDPQFHHQVAGVPGHRLGKDPRLPHRLLEAAEIFPEFGRQPHRSLRPAAESPGA